ncbi:LOW QUALITY PROTEIN: signal transducer and activator of transcription 1-like [Thalassophryne amazonica]|uniref:LOW QUALITY PROTEIN: signal transducer and activator of transcription 1-like n=1 Tax=Thalassophryne amazonica TaxID=390379 RepID=UPI0014713DDE|nr:LOW QUALITY PROTEIN: signal transducer and activator of transcription 1-like [Thalassophryne amazonica]
MMRQRDLNSKLEEIWNHTQTVEQEMKSLEELNDKLDSIPKTWQRQVDQWESSAETQAVMDDTDFITQTKQLVLQQINDILNGADQIVSTLLTVELPEWKCRQQWACIGGPANTQLDHLESWFTKVTQVLLQIHKQLMKFQEQNMKYVTDVPQLFDATREAKEVTCALVKKLLESALVVEKQPAALKRQRPLIISTKVNFTVTVRWSRWTVPGSQVLESVSKWILARSSSPPSSETLEVPWFSSPPMTAPVWWQQCLLQYQYRPVREELDGSQGSSQELGSSVFLNFWCHSSEPLRPEGVQSADLWMEEFGQMSLKEIKLRAQGSNKNLRVTEELHIIKFVTNLQFAGLDCNIEVTPLPFVVTSNTNQTSSAWASIMWCTMLTTSEQKNLSLFLNPQTVTWQQLAPVLSWQFLSVGKRALDENQLAALKDKFVDHQDGLVHWKTFSSPNGSAWIWLEGILDLIEKSLVDLWKDGCIMGFVSRRRHGVLLQASPTGTFLLSVLGESSKRRKPSPISWVDHSNGESYVHPVDPYTKKELSVMSLVDIIYHYSVTDRMNTTRNPLLYLYPDLHKDAAFGRYRAVPESTSSITVDGYVKRKHLLSSVDLTPPPSPPTDLPTMDDSDMDVDPVVESRYVVQDLFPAVLDVFPLSPQSAPSVGETSGFVL